MIGWLIRCRAFALLLPPDALQVVAFSISVAGALLMQGIEVVLKPADDQSHHLPPAFLFLSATCYAAFNLFGVLRSPFDLTAKIDQLNESFSQQRMLRTSASSNGSDTASSIGEQLDEVDPEAGSGRVQRVTRVQWLKQPPLTMVVLSSPEAPGGRAAVDEDEPSNLNSRTDSPSVEEGGADNANLA